MRVVHAFRAAATPHGRAAALLAVGVAVGWGSSMLPIRPDAALSAVEAPVRGSVHTPVQVLSSDVAAQGVEQGFVLRAAVPTASAAAAAGGVALRRPAVAARGADRTPSAVNATRPVIANATGARHGAPVAARIASHGAAPDTGGQPHAEATPVPPDGAVALVLRGVDLDAEPRRAQIVAAGSTGPALEMPWWRVGDAPAAGWTLIGIAADRVTLLDPSDRVVQVAR